jgi:transcriptional regulator with PAS, ATPase and Fis domain
VITRVNSSKRSDASSKLAPPLIGESDAIQTLRHDIDLAARSTAKVLITGETGTGKEVVSRLIHVRSSRDAEAFVTINCAGVPDTLLESEFFGHVRGSFTGAFRDNPGLLRQASGGTAFLDEVGEMSLRMQALFLRFLETGEIQSVGGGVSTFTDVRVVTATNRNLLEAVQAHEFREDLYYRLNVLHLHIPPLRERSGDIVLLLRHFGQLLALQHERTAPVFSPAAIDLLVGYQWPGNVRQLRNVVERIVARVTAAVIEPAHLPEEIVSGGAAGEEMPLMASTYAVSDAKRVAGLLSRILVQKESFWTTVYAAFMARDITRDDLRHIVVTGLEQTHGSYRVLLGLFNMAADDYKRFLGFLNQHDCHIPFRPFRMARARVTVAAADAPAKQRA